MVFLASGLPSLWGVLAWRCSGLHTGHGWGIKALLLPCLLSLCTSVSPLDTSSFLILSHLWVLPTLEDKWLPLSQLHGSWGRADCGRLTYLGCWWLLACLGVIGCDFMDLYVLLSHCTVSLQDTGLHFPFMLQKAEASLRVGYKPKSIHIHASV